MLNSGQGYQKRQPERILQGRGFQLKVNQSTKFQQDQLMQQQQKQARGSKREPRFVAAFPGVPIYSDDEDVEDEDKHEGSNEVITSIYSRKNKPSAADVQQSRESL
jgi:hypothetical protein